MKFLIDELLTSETTYDLEVAILIIIGILLLLAIIILTIIKKLKD